MENKIISDYTGFNFYEVGELDVVTYYTYLRDAFIYNCSQTEKGQEYLENAWYLEQTDCDREGLRKLAGGDKYGE